MTSQSRRLGIVIGLLPAAYLLTACAQGARNDREKTPPSAQQQSAKIEHLFRGKVERIDTTAKTLTVNGENVRGWMEAMTMVYTAEPPDVFSRVKVGDRISAKVYDGDFKTLHDIRVIQENTEK